MNRPSVGSVGVGSISVPREEGESCEGVEPEKMDVEVRAGVGGDESKRREGDGRLSQEALESDAWIREADGRLGGRGLGGIEVSGRCRSMCFQGEEEVKVERREEERGGSRVW